MVRMERNAGKILLFRVIPFRDSDACILKIVMPLAIRGRNMLSQLFTQFPETFNPFV